ncbi:hypothetical protein H6P81_020846 [Aristolochia fimbriata]|uniref:Heat shock factor binding protein n=1 Tax=Aristolochia fimbriata TaxID=158543 RepID=A0AAV7DYP8_ARIFI|nr:hypothetical protein H6P81_020846 [Aristolochia fimbriata]
MDGHDEDPKQSTADMTTFMGSRIDELEQSINDLKAEIGEPSASPVAATKTKSDEPNDGTA